MHELTDGRQAPLLPTWRYWVVVLFACPAAMAVPAGYLIAGIGPGVVWPVPAVLAALGVTIVAILRERRVRAMSAGWRAGWVAVGLSLGGALACVIAVAAFLAAVSTW